MHLLIIVANYGMEYTPHNLWKVDFALVILNVVLNIETENDLVKFALLYFVPFVAQRRWELHEKSRELTCLHVMFSVGAKDGPGLNESLYVFSL